MLAEIPKAVKQQFHPLNSAVVWGGILRCFWYSRNMRAKETPEQMARFADRFSAMGTEARLRILRLLLSAHPEGMVAGDLQSELGIPASTLSHHLDKLKNEDLVTVRRDGTFLWYSANTDALQELLTFLYSECCTRSKAIRPDVIVKLCR